MADPIAFVTESAYLDTAVVNGTQYYYVVRAIDAIQPGPVSNEASAIPALDPYASMDTATLWLDGQTLANVGDPIGAWSPSRGSHTPLQDTVAYRPVVGVEGSIKYASYDGADDRLVVASVVGSDLFATNLFALYMYVRPNSTDTQNTLIEWVQQNSNRVVIHPGLNGLFYFDHGDVGSGGRVSFSTPTAWTLGVWHLVEFHRNGNAVECVIDGVTVFTGSMSDTLGLTLAGTLVIGSQGAASFGGDISQWALFPLGHDETQRQEIRDTIALAAPIA